MEPVFEDSTFVNDNVLAIRTVSADYSLTEEDKRKRSELLRRYDLYEGLYKDIGCRSFLNPRKFNVICELRMKHTIEYTYPEMISEVIDRISTCGGIIFGGFVRDNIVSLEGGLSISPYSFRDIDVWITDESTGIDILDSLMEMKLIAIQVDSVGGRSMSFKIVHPTNHRTILFLMDLIIRENFPGRDVDINCLGWQDDQLKVFRNPEFEHVPDVDTLWQKIFDKTGTVLIHKEDQWQHFTENIPRYHHMAMKGFLIDFDLGDIRVKDTPKRGAFADEGDIFANRIIIKPLGSTAKRA